MTINLSKLSFSLHSKIRFIQRVVGVEDEKKAYSYLQTHESQIEYELFKTINNAKLLHQGFSPKNDGVLYDYYVNDKLLIVVSNPKMVVVTLYDIKMDAIDEYNSKKIKSYIENISKNINKIKFEDDKKQKIDIEAKHLEYMIDKTKKQLELLENELSNIIDSAKHQVPIIKKYRHENRDMMEGMLYGFKEVERKLN